MTWNPEQYLSFADQRGRPFFDLVGRVGAESPRRVVDLGCGPGNLTVTLRQRWPDATIEASDSSPEMVDAARRRGVPLAVHAIEDEKAAGLYERKLVLVRPDGHSAWRGDAMPADAMRLIDTVRGA